MKGCQFLNYLQLKNDKIDNLRKSKLNKDHKSDVFNVAYQQRIWIVFLSILKLNDCTEWHKHAGQNQQIKLIITVSDKQPTGIIVTLIRQQIL